MALRIELKYSKNEILLLYANNAPFGGNVVGISAAAWRYYGRSINHLSWAEAAYLAVLPNAPSLAFPGKNGSLLVSKRNRVLEKLKSKLVLKNSTYELVLHEPLPKRPLPLPTSSQHILHRSIKDGFAGNRIRSTLSKTYQIHYQSFS